MVIYFFFVYVFCLAGVFLAGVFLVSSVERVEEYVNQRTPEFQQRTKAECRIDKKGKA